MKSIKSPETFQLTLIAAKLMERKNRDVTSATTEAVRLWEACEAEVVNWPERVAEAKAHSELYESLVQDAKEIDSKGPILFDDALKRMMPKVKAPDRAARFRRFLMAHFQCDKIEAGKIIGNLHEKEWPGRLFKQYADGFTEWWSKELSEIRRNSRSRARKD